MNQTIGNAREAARELSKAAISKGFMPQALHVYTDEAGTPLYWRIRLKHPETGDKWVRPMKHDGTTFTLREPSFPDGGKPLYRLHKLVARVDEMVWVVEGETCVEELEKLGLLATTSGAADSASKTDWSPLAGRTVTIWPDNDEAGKRYGKAVAAILCELKCVVHIVDVVALNLPAKGDVVDWLKIYPSATQSYFENLPLVTDAIATEGDSSENLVDVRLLRGSDLTPEAVTWLWVNWLAAGKMHILGGAPGTGKTTISMALAATVTSGGLWPDGSRSPRGNVVIWSGEDDPTDTLVPRLILSGADMSRIYFIDDVRVGNERRAFDPARDMEVLRHKLNDIGDVRLVIVDPVVSAVAGEGNSNPQVRRSLQPLVDLGASLRCAVLGITHFSKGTSGRDPVERINGSLAFGALARIVLVAAKKQDEGEDGGALRLFCRAKSNIGPDDGGFEYDLHQDELISNPGIFASAVAWGKAVEGAARELLATADNVQEDGNGESVGSVSEWLRQLMEEEGGKVDRRDVMKAANAMGYKERTIHRAREKLGLVVQQHGFGKDKRSLWTWPAPPTSASIVPIMPHKIAGTHGMNGTNGTDEIVEVEV